MKRVSMTVNSPWPQMSSDVTLSKVRLIGYGCYIADNTILNEHKMSYRLSLKVTSDDIWCPSAAGWSQGNPRFFQISRDGFATDAAFPLYPSQ
jgi:hypothetical protein